MAKFYNKKQINKKTTTNAKMQDDFINVQTKQSFHTVMSKHTVMSQQLGQPLLNENGDNDHFSKNQAFGSKAPLTKHSLCDNASIAQAMNEVGQNTKCSMS